MQLSAVVDAVVGELTPAAARRRVALTVDIDETAPPVAGDAGQLGRMLRNLMSISLEEVPDGGRIEMRAWGGDAGQAVLEVRPRGSRSSRSSGGSFADARPVPPGRELGARGTNLSLAIAERIVTHHGGRVEAHGRSGSAGMFVVHLPASRLDDVTVEPVGVEPGGIPPDR